MSPIGPERAANIDDVVMQDATADAVGDFGGQAPPPRILPVLSDAAYDIIVLELFQDVRDIARVVLQVGVQRDDHLTARPFEARIQGSGLPCIVAQPDHPHFRPFGDQLSQDMRRAIATAIVDEEQFVARPQRRQRLRDRRRQRDEVFRFVIGGDDNGDLG